MGIEVLILEKSTRSLGEPFDWFGIYACSFGNRRQKLGRRSPERLLCLVSIGSWARQGLATRFVRGGAGSRPANACTARIAAPHGENGGMIESSGITDTRSTNKRRARNRRLPPAYHTGG